MSEKRALTCRRVALIDAAPELFEQLVVQVKSVGAAPKLSCWFGRAFPAESPSYLEQKMANKQGQICLKVN